MLAAGIAKGLRQVGFPCTSWANEGQVAVGIDGVQRGFMSVGGSKIHERLAHFFIDFYTHLSDL